MTDQIERALLTALSNLSGYRPEKAKRLWVIYETDIEQIVKDIKAGIVGDRTVDPKFKGPSLTHEEWRMVNSGEPPREVANDLPPSLAVKPNIAWRDQTLDQLYAERDYWVSKTEGTWGGAVGAAIEFRDGCNAWIRKREREVIAEDYHQGGA